MRWRLLLVMASDWACLLMQVNVGAGTITCNYGEAVVAALHLQQYLLLPPCCILQY